MRQAFIDVISDEALQTIGAAFEAVAETLETGEPDPIMSARSTPRRSSPASTGIACGEGVSLISRG